MKVAFAISVTLLLLFSAFVATRKPTPAPIVDPAASILPIAETIHPSLAGLMDENGNPIPNDPFQGQWSLVFFGYTRCPDVCPLTLGFLARLPESLPAIPFKLYFVSLDPEDSTASVKDYTDRFHKDIIGVTGDAASQEKAAKSFQAAYQTTENLMAHPTQVFVVNPHGELRYLMKNVNQPSELITFLAQLRRSH